MNDINMAIKYILISERLIAFCTFHLPASQVSLEKFGTSFAFEAGPCSEGIWPRPKDGHPPGLHLKRKPKIIIFIGK